MKHLNKFSEFENTQNESIWSNIKSGVSSAWNKLTSSRNKNDYEKMIDKELVNYKKFDLTAEHNFDTDDTEQWVRIYHHSKGAKILGQQAVYDALMSGQKFKKIFIQANIDTNNNPMILDIENEANSKQVKVEKCDESKLKSMTKNNHQGVIGIVGEGKRMIALIKQISDQLSLFIFLYQTETPSTQPGGGGGIKWNKNINADEETLINNQVEKPYARTAMKNAGDTPGGLQSLLQSVYRFWYLKTRTGKAKKKSAYSTGI